MRIAIGTDHAGFEYKEQIKRYLEEQGHEVRDFGTDSNESVDYPLFILARGGNLRLLTDEPPHPCQRGMAVDFHLILKNQNLLGIVSHRFFFKPTRSFLAFSYACSSRLPLRVCLGRWMEKPSWCRSLRN